MASIAIRRTFKTDFSLCILKRLSIWIFFILNLCQPTFRQKIATNCYQCYQLFVCCCNLFILKENQQNSIDLLNVTLEKQIHQLIKENQKPIRLTSNKRLRYYKTVVTFLNVWMSPRQLYPQSKGQLFMEKSNIIFIEDL